MYLVCQEPPDINLSLSIIEVNFDDTVYVKINLV